MNYFYNLLKRRMPTLEQILAQSKQVEKNYEEYMSKKVEREQSMKETQEKIQKAMDKIKSTKQTISSIDNIYERFQKSFEDTINQALKKLEISQSIDVADPDFKPDYRNPQQVANIINSAKKVVFLTGAGISAASGIPTFRDSKGYWTKKREEGMNPQEFLTLSNFEQNQFEIWEWLDDFYATKMKCKHNLGHTCVDGICNKLKNDAKQVCLITQNIDNLHVESQKQMIFQIQKENSYPIYEIHGNILKVRCQKCSEQEKTLITYPYIDFRKLIAKRQRPKCIKCESFLRPHIMFFDECYTQTYHKSETIYTFLQDSDLCIVIGTALKTGMARNIVQTFLTKSLPIIEINIECEIRQKNTIWMEGKSEEFLVKISNNLQ